jgi:hypothetical protein
VVEERARARGRPAAATRTAVLAAATRRFRARGAHRRPRDRGRARSGRATVNRWFGSRIGLIGEVIVAEMEALVVDARASARGTGAAASSARRASPSCR